MFVIFQMSGQISNSGTRLLDNPSGSDLLSHARRVAPSCVLCINAIMHMHYKASIGLRCILSLRARKWSSAFPKQWQN